MVKSVKFPAFYVQIPRGSGRFCDPSCLQARADDSDEAEDQGWMVNGEVIPWCKVVSYTHFMMINHWDDISMIWLFWVILGISYHRYIIPMVNHTWWYDMIWYDNDKTWQSYDWSYYDCFCGAYEGIRVKWPLVCHLYPLTLAVSCQLLCGLNLLVP